MGPARRRDGVVCCTSCPWTSLAGAFLLSCTMLGAMLVHIAVRHSIGASLYPAVILLAIIMISLRERD